MLVGRDEPLRDIAAYLAPRTRAPRVAVLTGRPGVGKSALAVGVCQALAAQFPDGQLLARLDRVPEGEAGVAQVLDMFVRSLRLGTGSVPQTDIDDLGERYRRLTRRRKVLIVLDAVTDIDQVRPLLPRGRGCAVIITSRNPNLRNPNLRDAAERESSWRSFPIDQLPDDAALDLLDALLGHDGRVRDEPAAARLLVTAAAGMPFALQLIGSALSARRHWTLQAAVQRMHKGGLASDSTGTVEEAIAPPEFTAALDLSYALLTEEERRALLLLCLVDEPSFTAWHLGVLLQAARSVPGREPSAETETEATDTAEQILERLAYGRLIGRAVDSGTGMAAFRLTEQVEPYLRLRLSDEPVDTTRIRAALDRERTPVGPRLHQVSHLVEAGQLFAALKLARQLLTDAQQRVDMADGGDRRAAQGDEGLALAALAEVSVELGWLEEARQASTAAGDDKTGLGRFHAATFRAATFRAGKSRALRYLASVQARHNQLGDARHTLVDAVAAAAGLTDRTDAIRALRDLAVVQARLGQYDEAMDTIEQAVSMSSKETDDQWGADALCLWGRGLVLLIRGDDLPGAEQALLAAESRCGNANGSDGGASRALWLAWIHHDLAMVALARGDYARTRHVASQANQGFRTMNHRYGIAHCRMVVGRSYLEEANELRATQVLEEAAQAFDSCGDRWAEAECRRWLAEAHLAGKRYPQAAAQLAQAEQDFDDLDDEQSSAAARDRLIDVSQQRRRDLMAEKRVFRATLPLIRLGTRS